MDRQLLTVLLHGNKAGLLQVAGRKFCGTHHLSNQTSVSILAGFLLGATAIIFPGLKVVL